MTWTWPGLTPRQVEIAELICRGGSRIEIARVVGCEPRTYDTHRMKILSRYRCENAVQLVLHALRAGWRPDTQLQLHFNQEEENGKENEG